MRKTLFGILCLVALGCGEDDENPPGGNEGGAASSSGEGAAGANGGTGSGAMGGSGGAGADCARGGRADPLLHYRFDGDATNAGTLGASFDGAAKGGVTWIDGQLGQAARFQGPACRGAPAAEPHQVDLPGTAALLGDKPKLTIGLWFREEAMPATECVTQLIESRSDLSGFETYQGATPEELTTCATLGAEAKGWCGSLPFSFGAWHHLLYRWDGTSNQDGGGAPLQIYLDGALALTMDNADNLALFTPAMNDLIIGRYSFFDVDDLRIFDAVFDEQGQCTEVMGGAWCDGACVISR